MFTMSDWGKRMGAVFLFAVMIAAVLLGNALPAQAYRYTDPYVLHGEYRENGEPWLTYGDVSVLGYPLGDDPIILPGQRYRRVNLEDGEGMDAARAGKIRAVILAVQDLKELQRAANRWLGEDVIQNLTDEEAVNAAREAIGCHISGDAPAGDSPALTRYLFALPPVVPDTLAVSDNSLHIRSAAAQLQPDGTYRVEVEFTTTTTCGPGDELTVTVFCGEMQRSLLLTEQNLEDVHRAVFSCEVCPEEIRVEINGYQQGMGVFLFVPVDGNTLLAGWDDRVLPVHAEVTAFVAGDLVLDIRGEGPGEVEIYRVAELWALLSGTVRADTANPDGYKRDENHVATLTTDENGHTAVNLSRCGYSEGVYLISGEDTGLEDTFVCIPAPEGEQWRYTVTVEPERGLYLIWWIALIVGLLTGTAVAAALLLRFGRK